MERQTGHFFKLKITEEDLKNGVVISCTSNGSDKFKVVFFDNEGHVTMVEESQKRKRHSESNLYVVPFGRYNLSETMPMSMMRHLDEEVPPVFMILDTFDKGKILLHSKPNKSLENYISYPYHYILKYFQTPYLLQM